MMIQTSYLSERILSDGISTVPCGLFLHILRSVAGRHRAISLSLLLIRERIFFIFNKL